MSLLWFIFGELLHILMQVDGAVRDKTNGHKTYWDVLKWRAVPYVVRAALCCAVYVLWLEGGLAALLMASGVNLPDSVAKVLALHVTGALAVIGGYMSDSILTYLPFLKVPDPPPLP